MRIKLLMAFLGCLPGLTGAASGGRAGHAGEKR